MTTPTKQPTRQPERVTDAAEGAYRWVYLWHWPIRTMHWVAAGSIVVLVVTGLYIANPFFMTGGEGTPRFAMGWMRFLHFVAAAALVTTGIVRVYWLFAGNKFERFAALFPVRPRDWVNMVRVVKKYLMIRPEAQPHYLAHNPLQQLSYTAIYAVTIVEVITGFAMYGQANPGGFFYLAFGWAVPLLGGIQLVHFVHHALMWVFLIFIPIHLYLGVRSDVMEREGTMSSIFSGGRFVRADEEYVDD